MNELENRILEQIDNRKEELFKYLTDMIAIESQSFGDTGTGHEEAMAKHLNMKFKELGLDSEVYSPIEAGCENNIDYYPGRHLENRYNCSALVYGSNHSKRIMLAGHEDTVIAGNLEKWKTNPFEGVIKDGRIYGRGACDDKYALASSLFLIKLFKENNIVLPYDMVIVGYSDEENGGGNGAMAAGLRHKCDEIISLDGHGMEIIAGGAGGGVVKCTITSDVPTDSCEKMMDGFGVLRKEWEKFREERKKEFLEKQYFKDTEIPYTTVRYTDIHTGMAGSAMGTISALITFYTVHNEEDTRKEWGEMIQRINKDLALLNMRVDSFQMITRFFHYCETEENNHAMGLMSDIVSEMTDYEPKPVGMCLSDLPMFILHGSPRAFAFGCGRGFDKEGGAHQINEYIECSDLIEYVKVLATFLLRYK